MSTQQLNIFSKTHIGQKRQNNEDSFIANEEMQLFIVCDGMGGHAAGEIASKLAVQETNRFIVEQKSTIEKEKKKPGGYYQLVKIAKEAVEKSCSLVFRNAVKKSAYHGMGTTLTLLWVIDNKAIMAHVGDSRLYLLRNDEIHLLSNDHTLANESKMNIAPGLANVLTRSIGSAESVVVDTLMFDVLEGDKYLLCSDGLSNYFYNHSEIQEYLSHKDIKKSGDALIDMANHKGGQDNITLILVNVEKSIDEATQRADKILRLLEKQPLFNKFSYKQIIRIKNHCKIVNIPAGEEFLKEGRLCQQFCMVLEGRFTILKKLVPLGTIKEYQCFGEENLFAQQPSSFTAKAKTDVKLLVLERNDFKKMIKDYPRLSNHIFINLTTYFENAYLKRYGIRIPE